MGHVIANIHITLLIKRNVTQGAQMMRALYVLWYTKMHQYIETDVC